MPTRLTLPQQEALEKWFGLQLGASVRGFQLVNIHPTLSLPLGDATLLHCGGADAAPFWEARGLKGYRFDRQDRQEQQHEELAKAVERTYTAEGVLRAEAINPFLTKAVELFNLLLTDRNPFDVQGLADKKVVVVVGFWRSLGTLMLWRVLRLMGIEPLGLNPFMMHDNMPDVAVLERHSYWSGHLSAYFQFCQYLAWAAETFAAHPVIVHKNSSHLYWLQSLDSLLGDRATYQFTIRHPVTSAISLFSTSTQDVEALAASKSVPSANVWKRTVQRALGTPDQEWEEMSLLEKAIEHWTAYHVLANLNGSLAGRMHVFRFGDDLEDYLARTLPFTVDAPPQGDEIMAPSRRSYEHFMTPAVTARSERAIARARHHFATFGIDLPDLPLL